ncbi:MAG: ribonuclease HII [Lachnospiraceae bacterium]|nr:ribonuclease HII [Lachnospiraceae bacterium]
MGTELSLKEIEAILEATPMERLKITCLYYKQDERPGVKKLVEKYEKKLFRFTKELSRLDNMLIYERKYGEYPFIAGIDEAGRGPLAGPVVAAAVILPKDHPILYLNDSKKLTEKRREALYDEIMRDAVSVGVGMAKEDRIDEVNILNATYEAMRDAVDKLSLKPDITLNDAVKIPDLSVARQVPIVKGDAKSLSIAAASVIAKVTRDRLMVEYDSLYPEYGFAAHKGYGTEQHVEALKKYGPCPIHRQTFIQHFIGDERE